MVTLLACGDSHENEHVKIGIETCKDSSLVLLYCSWGVENCLVVSIETMHEAFKEQKLFCPTPTTKYCRSMVGMEVFLVVQGCDIE